MGTRIRTGSALLLMGMTTAAAAAPQPDGQIRYRAEQVDEEGFGDKALAATVRTQLGVTAPLREGLKGRLEFEDVSVAGSDDYNSTSNGKTGYPVVPDPEATEINELYLDWRGEGWGARVGRQALAFDNHRFVGTVKWRQNEQTLDAARLDISLGESAELNWVWLDEANRIFGARETPLDDHNSHLGRVSVAGFGQWTGYAYLLDFPDAPAASNRTVGLRWTADAVLPEPWGLTLEIADQADYADGEGNEADYYHATGRYQAGPVAVGLGQEVLGGDGTYGFSTPLATVHAFNGWADRFLSTPAEGLEDTYLSLGGKAGGFRLKAVYHTFTADAADHDFGQELDLVAIRPLSEGLTLVLKYADYTASDDAGNTGAPARDATKAWAQLDFRF